MEAPRRELTGTPPVRNGGKLAHHEGSQRKAEPLSIPGNKQRFFFFCCFRETSRTSAIHQAILLQCACASPEFPIGRSGQRVRHQPRPHYPSAILSMRSMTSPSTRSVRAHAETSVTRQSGGNSYGGAPLKRLRRAHSEIHIGFAPESCRR